MLPATKILTVTFSPCIDKSTSVPALVAEKKLKCSTPVLEPGGGGINVARAVIKLGGSATAIYPAGGLNGQLFNNLLKEEHVPAIVINTKEETRENIIVLDASTNQQYRFGMPGTWMSDHECQQMLQAIDDAANVEYIVASGSLPPGVPVDIFASIAILARKKNARFIVDTSGEALRYAAQEGVFLIKPNLAELSALAGKECLQTREIPAAAKQIIHKGNCEAVVVSMGSLGAMLITADTEITISSPPVERKSTVGAGDSMVAGIVLSLSQGQDLSTAVRYGVACGTAATMNPGTELCRIGDVEKLFRYMKESHSKPECQPVTK